MAMPDGKVGMRYVHRAWLTLSGIVFALAALNLATFWLYPETPPPDYVEAMFIGAWVFQPMLLGIWTALGPGRFVTRLPLVVPCLVLVAAAPGLHRAGFDLERREFIVIVAAGIAILLVTSGLLFIVRRFTGWRIAQSFHEAHRGPSCFQFDLKYLLILITLWAAALGITSSLVFAPPNPSTFFGFNFFVHVAAIGGAAISAMLLPTVAVPLFVLSAPVSKRFVVYWGAFWALEICLATAVWRLIEIQPLWQILQWELLMQFGAGVVGAIAALALRWAGYRLTNESFKTTE